MIFHASFVGFSVTRTQLLDIVKMLLKDIKQETFLQIIDLGVGGTTVF